VVACARRPIAPNKNAQLYGQLLALELTTTFLVAGLLKQADGSVPASSSSAEQDATAARYKLQQMDMLIQAMRWEAVQMGTDAFNMYMDGYMLRDSTR